MTQHNIERFRLIKKVMGGIRDKFIWSQVFICLIDAIWTFYISINIKHPMTHLSISCGNLNGPDDASVTAVTPCRSCCSTAGLPEMLQSVITSLFSINQKLPGPGLPCPRNNHLRLFNISQTFSILKNKK